MIDRIINAYLSDLTRKGVKFEPSFVGTEVGRLTSLLNIVNLPQRVTKSQHIDTLHLSPKVKLLYDKFEECCYSADSTLITTSSYKICPYIISMLVEKLYKRCLIEEVTIPTILYIDTEELVADLSKHIKRSKEDTENYIRTSNSDEVIYNYLYTARYIFWDRFSLNFSNYYNNYIYEVIKSRYNNCLGNMYFTTTDYKSFCESFDMNTLDLLNIKEGIFQLAEEERQSKIILVEEG